MTTLFFDIETDGLDVDLTKIHCLAIGTEDGSIQGYADYPGYEPILSGVSRLADADKLVAHNGIDFDMQVVNKWYPNTICLEQMEDTMILSQLLDPERPGKHSLKSWGKSLGFEKGEFTAFDCFTDEMMEYCKRDIQVLIKLYNMLKEEFNKSGLSWDDAIDLEYKVSFVLMLQNTRGFRVDLDEILNTETKLRQELEEIAQGCQKIFPVQYVPSSGTWDFKNRTWRTEEVVPKVNNKTSGTTKDVPYTKVELEEFSAASRDQIAQRLSSKFSWVPTIYTETGKPKLTDKILSMINIEKIKPLKRYFRIMKMLGQIADGKQAWLKHVKNDRIHGSMFSTGCRTHRMSHFNPNISQVDKELRKAWIADVNQVLVDCDADGLEVRMLAHYLTMFGNTEYARIIEHGDKSLGTDVHSVNQKLTDLPTRDDAKTLIFALFYGGGDLRIGRIALKDGSYRQAIARGKQIKMKLINGIVGLKPLIEKCQKRHDERKYLIGIDGRKIDSESQHSALNTLLQSAGAIVMKQALVIFHYDLLVKEGLVDSKTWLPTTNDFGYVANVHDEIVLTVVPELAEKLGQLLSKSIELAGNRYQLKCKLSGSYSIGTNWHEVH